MKYQKMKKIKANFFYCFDYLIILDYSLNIGNRTRHTGKHTQNFIILDWEIKSNFTIHRLICPCRSQHVLPLLLVLVK